jgi:hypothetical protein
MRKIGEKGGLSQWQKAKRRNAQASKAARIRWQRESANGGAAHE